MKLGVFTCLLGNLPLEEALKYFKSKGIEMVEIGCGGYPGNSHADPDTLLADPAALSTFKSTVADSGLEISALSCHGNPVHPNKAIAAEFDKTIKNTILLAEKLGIHQINTFSAAIPMSMCSRHGTQICRASACRGGSATERCSRTAAQIILPTARKIY